MTGGLGWPASSEDPDVKPTDVELSKPSGLGWPVESDGMHPVHQPEETS